MRASHVPCPRGWEEFVAPSSHLVTMRVASLSHASPAARCSSAPHSTDDRFRIHISHGRDCARTLPPVTQRAAGKLDATGSCTPAEAAGRNSAPNRRAAVTPSTAATGARAGAALQRSKRFSSARWRAARARSSRFVSQALLDPGGPLPRDLPTRRCSQPLPRPAHYRCVMRAQVISSPAYDSQMLRATYCTTRT